MYRHQNWTFSCTHKIKIDQLRRIVTVLFDNICSSYIFKDLWANIYIYSVLPAGLGRPFSIT